MAYSRNSQPACRPTPGTFTGQMVGIGMNFAAAPIRDANVEDTLLLAAEAGMLDGDLRVLGLLVHWLEVHRACVNADRLVRALRGHGEARVLAFWASVGAMLQKDRRFSRLCKLSKGPSVELLPAGTDYLIARHGKDERFAGTMILVPAGTLRRRKADILSPIQLARQHAGYRNRVLFGPTWRADVWTALEAEPDISVSSAARRAYCAFATAWQVKQDFKLLEAAAEASSSSATDGDGSGTVCTAGTGIRG